MKSTIILLTCCILGAMTASCRCDFEEDEARNKDVNKAAQNEKIRR